jgi:TonB family protein
MPPVRPEWADGRTIQIVLALEVDDAGKVNSCTPEVSSGIAMVDESACLVVKRRARFVPGYPGVHILPIKLQAG